MLKLLFASILLIGLVACGERQDSKITAEQSVQKQEIKFTCSKKELCDRVAIGIIHFGSSFDQRVLKQRCIATIIGKNKIITSRFCTEATLNVSLADGVQLQSDIYFSLPESSTKSSRIIRSFMSSPDPNGVDEANFVVFDIEPVEELPLPVNPNERIAIGSKYSGFIVEDSWIAKTNAFELVLKKVENCEPVESPIFFPYKFTQRASVFPISGCNVTRGSAGSPVISDEGFLVGVLHSRVDTEAAFNFVSAQFEGLIDWGNDYKLNFGLVTHISCVSALFSNVTADFCETLGKKIPAIAQFPDAGYTFLNESKKQLIQLFGSYFPSPYSYLEWTLQFEMIKQPGATFAIQASMRPKCFNLHFSEFFKKSSKINYDAEKDEASWGISAGFLTSRLSMNDKFQIVPEIKELFVENLKFSAENASKFNDKEIIVSVSHPFKQKRERLTIRECKAASAAPLSPTLWEIEPIAYEL